MSTASLTAENGYIWRITHRDNMPWILRHGLHCSSAPHRDPNFVSIGNAELISKRHDRPVSVHPGGVLGDYVPFYFTPYSPMMLNITSGRNGVTRRSNEEIVILVSKLSHLASIPVPFVFTPVHAYLRYATFHSDLNDLALVDWTLLRSRNFSRDREDPSKFDRYQAEALAHRHVPVAGLLGAICYTPAVQASIDQQAKQLGLQFSTLVKQSWYF